MRLFELRRDEDLTGVSGTGTVAGGVEWDDGRVAMRWFTNINSTVLYDDMEAVNYIHGHDGRTKVVYLDEPGSSR
jgi:hypothetical protein